MNYCGEELSVARGPRCSSFLHHTFRVKSMSTVRLARSPEMRAKFALRLAKESHGMQIFLARLFFSFSSPTSITLHSCCTRAASLFKSILYLA